MNFGFFGPDEDFAAYAHNLDECACKSCQGLHDQPSIRPADNNGVTMLMQANERRYVRNFN